MKYIILIIALAILAGCDMNESVLVQEGEQNYLPEKRNKVEVCHKNDEGGYNKIEISESALQAHLNHGDGQPGDDVPDKEGFIFTEDCDCIPASVDYLLMGTNNPDKILRFNETTGAFIEDLVSAGSGGLDDPFGLAIGSDGKLYVSSRHTDNVLRYDNTSGAFVDEFVPAGTNGLNTPHGLIFGPDENLYVVNNNGHNVLRFNGTTGAFIDIFASGGLRVFLPL
ncbi:MAG: hypothetical protein IH852_03445 [Bacteroidetes bacterium]|nr:hypothetical protein [Bacteroidota bacterium]